MIEAVSNIKWGFPINKNKQSMLVSLFRNARILPASKFHSPMVEIIIGISKLKLNEL